MRFREFRRRSQLDDRAAGALVLSAISLAASLRPQSGVLKHEFDDVTRRITAPPGNFVTGL